MIYTYYKPTCFICNKIETISSLDTIDNNHLDFFDHSHFDSLIIEKTLFMIEYGHWKNEPIEWSFYANTHKLENILLPPDIKEKFHNSFNSAFYFNIEDINKDFENRKKLHQTWSYLKGSYNDIIILNNSKKEFIDLCEYKYLSPFDKRDLFHPLPFLTNSETLDKKYLDNEESNMLFQSHWKNDCLEVVRTISEIPLNYKNISHISFYLEQNMYEQHKNKFLLNVQRSQIDENRLKYKNDFFDSQKLELEKVIKDNTTVKLFFNSNNIVNSLIGKIKNIDTDNSVFYFYDESKSEIIKIEQKCFLKIEKKY